MRFVDKITKSKYFQKATETEFIKKKMEEVSNTPLLLTVEVQECRGTLAVNIPPPPTDRIWCVYALVIPLPHDHKVLAYLTLDRRIPTRFLLDSRQSLVIVFSPMTVSCTFLRMVFMCLGGAVSVLGPLFSKAGSSIITVILCSRPSSLPSLGRNHSTG